MIYLCSFCGESDPDKFYGRKRTRCAKCHNKDVIERGRKAKEYMIELLGGKCVRCGYNKCPDALDFHHTTPEKDKNFKSKRGWSKERIQKELKGCLLLCANCHREEHYNQRVV